MSRRERIVQFLERWEDLQALVSAAGGQGDETRVPLGAHDRHCGVYSSLRCTCWLRSLAELERVLRRLRTEQPGVYAHLNGRYWHTTKARRRNVRFRAGHWQGLAANETVLIPRFEAGQRGERERVYDDVLIVRWPPWVDLATVGRALDWLEREYPLEPQLPREAVAA